MDLHIYGSTHLWTYTSGKAKTSAGLVPGWCGPRVHTSRACGPMVRTRAGPARAAPARRVVGDGDDDDDDDAVTMIMTMMMMMTTTTTMMTTTMTTMTTVGTNCHHHEQSAGPGTPPRAPEGVAVMIETGSRL